MIGKPEWFKYRIFGWGLAPKTWQGWVYTATLATVLGFVTAVTATSALHPFAFGIIFAIVIADVIHIMTQMPKTNDERENYHQLLVERNCSFAAVGTLVAVALYQAYQHRALLQTGVAIPFDLSLAIVFLAMLVTKVVSTAYVKMRG